MKFSALNQNKTGVGTRFNSYMLTFCLKKIKYLIYDNTMFLFRNLKKNSELLKSFPKNIYPIFYGILFYGVKFKTSPCRYDFTQLKIN